MASSDALDSFTQYPLELDPTTKAITLSPSSEQNDVINAELKSLNLLHRALVGLERPNVPPPPLPINPKRSAQITKLRDTANTAYRKSNYPEAIKLYGYAIEMAITRPAWEPLSLVREELSGLYANRAQAHMAQRTWPDGWVDSKCSVECKASGNTKGWWRGGKCLVEMGRWAEALSWIQRGLEVEEKEKNGEGAKELLSLMAEIEKGLQRQTQLS